MSIPRYEIAAVPTRHINDLRYNRIAPNIQAIGDIVNDVIILRGAGVPNETQLLAME